METNNNGETPQNGESQPTDAVGDQNKGSESRESNAAADKNNVPPESKKGRRTDAEILAAWQKKLGEVIAKQREVQARVDKTKNKELLKLKIVLGEACLNYIRDRENPDNVTKLIILLRKAASDSNKKWLTENFVRLLELHTKPQQQANDANGESPSKS